MAGFVEKRKKTLAFAQIVRALQSGAPDTQVQPLPIEVFKTPSEKTTTLLELSQRWKKKAAAQSQSS